MTGKDGLVPQKRRDRNGVLRTVYVRPAGPGKGGNRRLPPPATPKRTPAEKPMRPAELQQIMRRLFARLGNRAVTPPVWSAMRRLASVSPETVTAFADQLDASGDYEAELLDAMIDGTPSDTDDERYVEMFRVNMFLSSVIAQIHPDRTPKQTYAGIHAADQLRLLFSKSVARSPRPVTEAGIKALLLAQWASGFHSESEPLDPVAHDADLRYIEENIDALLARRDFIDVRRPRPDRPFEETMDVLRLAMSDGTTALMDGAL